MVIRIEHWIFNQIVKSVSVGSKKVNAERRLCAKRLHRQSYRLGGSYLFMKYDVSDKLQIFFDYNKRLTICTLCDEQDIEDEYHVIIK